VLRTETNAPNSSSDSCPDADLVCRAESAWGGDGDPSLLLLTTEDTNGWDGTRGVPSAFIFDSVNESGRGENGSNGVSAMSFCVSICDFGRCKRVGGVGDRDGSDCDDYLRHEVVDGRQRGPAQS
jgi:hypothetical protein